MSVPSMISRLSGLASYSAGSGRTGRRLANRPRPLRRPSSPCSGRGLDGSVVSHLGPPTAASRTASAERHAASVSSVSALPWASIEAPPNGCSSYSSSTPAAPSTSTVGPMISGPIPSPGSRTTLGAIRRETVPKLVREHELVEALLRCHRCRPVDSGERVLDHLLRRVERFGDLEVVPRDRPLAQLRSRQAGTEP